VTARDKFSPEYRELLTTLVAARRVKNLTQAEVAKKLGLRQPTLSKVEAGEYQLGLLDFVRYCQAVDLDPADGIRRLANAAGKAS
jgi:transcriptional regulator with XRE-family HTH domain